MTTRYQNRYQNFVAAIRNILSLPAQVAKLTSVIDDLECQIEELQNENAELKESIDDLESDDFSELERRVEDIESDDFDALTGRVDELDINVEKLEASVEKLEEYAATWPD